MKLLILAAGYGTRLQSIAKNTAKALLKVGKKPILEHILEHAKGLPGLDEAIIVTNAKYYEDFKAWSKSASAKAGYKITVVNDRTTSNENRLGSIGDIDFVLNEGHIKEDLLVVGGDNLYNFNIDEFVAAAAARKESVTIGLYDVQDLAQANQYGIVEIAGDGKVVSFEEKPARPKSTLASMCLYFFPKKTLGLIGDYLLQSGKSDRAGDYIVWLLKHHVVFGFKFKGKWFDIGSVESYHEAQEAFADK